jgi:hypothetical protein
MAERPDLDGRDPATLTDLEKLAYAYPEVAELVRERDEAHAALPPSVAGDAAPESATLADRIRALAVERDRAHAGHGECHRLHQAAQAELAALRAMRQRAQQMTTSGRTALERAAAEHILGES